MKIVVMGVSGCGKTSVGVALAEQLRLPFHDADDHHSEENREKMRRGTSLSDEDRRPWLECLSLLLAGQDCVLACSALRLSYRIHDTKSKPEACFRCQELIQRRLEQRKGHYFKVGLLQSQFDILEEPVDGEEKSLTVECGGRSVPDIVQTILTYLKIVTGERTTADLGSNESTSTNLLGFRWRRLGLG